MIFHRLRLISFSKSVLSLKGSRKKNTHKKVYTEDISSVVVASTPKVAQIEQGLLENTTEYCIKTSSSTLDRMLVKPRLEFKSKSETFRVPSKGKPCTRLYGTIEEYIPTTYPSCPIKNN